MIKLIFKDKKAVDVTGCTFEPTSACLKNSLGEYAQENMLAVKKPDATVKQYIMDAIDHVEVNKTKINFAQGFRKDTPDWVNARINALREADTLNREEEIKKKAKAKSTDAAGEGTKTQTPENPSGQGIDTPTGDAGEGLVNPQTVNVVFKNIRTESGELTVAVPSGITVADLFHEHAFKSEEFLQAIKSNNEEKFTFWTTHEGDKDVKLNVNDKEKIIDSDIIIEGHWKRK